MFNELNSQPNNRQPIDDIFAETDKPVSNQTNGIETHRVGLTTADASAPVVSVDDSIAAKSKIPWFKVIAIVIVAAILILSAYLVYSKFFKAGSIAVVTEKPLSQTPTTTVIPINVNVNIATTTTDTGQNSSNSTYVPEIPGLASTSVSTTTSSVDLTLDSDHDGLTDVEEATYGTNPLVADTDSDGLGDYEEIKIYHTNPLLADTDGDGYLDGAEVKNGYNPNGPGKLPGLSATSTIVK